MMTTTVQVATEADHPGLARLRSAWAAEVQPGEDAAFAGRFDSWIAEQRGWRTFWVARDGARPVGMVNLLVIERMPRPELPSGRWGYLGNLFVLPAWRRRGVGTRLVDAVRAHAAARDLERVIAHPNDASLPFWRRSAFSQAADLFVWAV
jgi:GNAT superfamily N-acetyltransferase